MKGRLFVNVFREETGPGCEGLICVRFARIAVAIKKNTETLVRISRGPVIHVIKNRIQRATLLATKGCCLPGQIGAAGCCP